MKTTEPHFHSPIRSDLDVAIDLAWHRHAHATDPIVQARYSRELNDLIRQRAAGAQAPAPVASDAR